MRFYIILLLLGLRAAGAAAQPTFLPDLSRDYQLVFADDFHYASRDSLLSPHLNKWAPQHSWGNAHWDMAATCANIGPDSYAYRPEDVRLVPNPEQADDQLLALDFTYHPDPLRSITSASGTTERGTFYKTSGMVRALFRGDSACGDPGFKYGVFQIRCKAPSTAGLQAAFWLWAGGGACGVNPPDWRPSDTWEIDGFETLRIGDYRDFYSTRQANSYSLHKSSATKYYFPANHGPDQEFHTYTVVWTANVLAWYADGKLYKVLRNPRNPAKARLNPAGIPQTELSLLISSHYQWDCKNNYHCDTLADSVTVNDQQCPPPNDPFLIDYVRVYRPRQLAADGAWPLVEQRRRRAKVAAAVTQR